MIEGLKYFQPFFMKTKIAIKILKLDDGFHLVLSIRVNGKPARMVLDTGASKTVFDKTNIKKFLKLEKFESHDKLSTGLGTNDMKSHLVVIKKMKVGEINISDYKSVVIDLSHVNNAYLHMKQKPIDGILGSDILRKYKAVIDYSEGMLLLRKA